MSIFNTAVRVAMNPTVPTGGRFNAFIECCDAYAGLANTGKEVVIETLGTLVGFASQDRLNDDQIAKAMSVLVAARFALLHEIRTRDARRKEGKRKGLSPPTEESFPTDMGLDLLRKKGSFYSQMKDSEPSHP